MIFLHNKSILHRDLKPENVLITAKEEAKIMDFGLSLIITNEKTRTISVGTSFYIAPEVLEGHYSFPCDVYSFSMLMYVIFSEIYDPFGKKSFYISKSLARDPNMRPNTKNLEIPKEIKECIINNWNHDPKKRMNFKKILKIFENFDQKKQIIDKEIGIESNINEVYFLKQRIKELEESKKEEQLIAEKKIKVLEKKNKELSEMLKE